MAVDALRQRVEALDRLIQDLSRSPWEITPGRPVIRHENSVSHEEGIADLGGSSLIEEVLNLHNSFLGFCGTYQQRGISDATHDPAANREKTLLFVADLAGL